MRIGNPFFQESVSKTVKYKEVPVGSIFYFKNKEYIKTATGPQRSEEGERLRGRPITSKIVAPDDLVQV